MFQAIRRIANHPLTRLQLPKSISRYLSWQISSRLGKPEQFKPWLNGLNVIVKRGFHASTACHYFGLPEFESMAFMLHFLKEGDVFFDVGSNIGAYSVLASGVNKAYSIAFEPEPATCSLLKRNIALNKLDSYVEIHQLALGAKIQSVQLTAEKGIQNHILTSNKDRGIEIEMSTLDKFGLDKPPILIKLDVEGFETEVIDGAVQTIKLPAVKALIVERMGLGQRFGFDEALLHKRLLSQGFELFEYQPFTRQLTPLSIPAWGNNLYLRGLKKVEERIKSAPKIEVLGHCF